MVFWHIVKRPSSSVHTPITIRHLQGVSRIELASLARGRGGGLWLGRSECDSSSRSAATTLRDLEPRPWRLGCCSGVLGLQRSGVSVLLGGWEGERSWELEREWEREEGLSWEAEREWEADQDPPRRWAALLTRCRGQGGESGQVRLACVRRVCTQVPGVPARAVVARWGGFRV